MFKAIEGTFDTTVDDVVPLTLNANPNKGFITTNPINNQSFTGILLKGSMACEELTPQSFNLLADKDFDETTLLS
jgi:hypothetical protein